MKFIRMIGALIALLAVSGSAAAQSLTAETRGKIEVAAPTFTTFGDFYRNTPTTAGKITIDIQLPDGAGPFPAVIVSHTVGGWNSDVDGDAMRRLLKAGYAVGGLDHFAPRGLRDAASGGFTTAAAASDALIALKLFATHPRIDATRIAMIGFSMGGQAAQLSAYEPIRRAFAGEARFAAHVSFYGPCSLVALDGARTMTGAPVLLLFGGKDETTPPERCGQIETLVKAVQPDAPLQAIWYPDAYHAWNNPKLAEARFFRDHRSTRACPLIDFGASFGMIDASGQRSPFRPQVFADCTKQGAGYSMGYSERVTEQSWRDALAFLDARLKK